MTSGSLIWKSAKSKLFGEYIMPMKIKPSQTVKDRTTGKTHVQHFYMKCTSTEELVKLYEARNTMPKLRNKLRNELVKRKVPVPVLPE